ncbi:MAG: heme exporter protein CcmB [Rhizobiales bacterium]|nr:heme exporter protein CcmB [Hyphomicrobiales bacterium]
MTATAALLRREVLLAFASGSGLGTALGFLLIVVSILPLGLGPDMNLLGRIAPGILWIGLLLSALLSADRLFYDDARDGTLELLTLGPYPLALVALVKILAHWAFAALPLIAAIPLLGLMLNLEANAYGPLVATMLVGSPAISSIGAIGGALTIGVSRGGLLLSLIVLPFYIPTLVFGVSALDAVLVGPGDFGPPFAILAAISLASLVLGPLAAAAALKLQLG